MELSTEQVMAGIPGNLSVLPHTILYIVFFSQTILMDILSEHMVPLHEAQILVQVGIILLIFMIFILGQSILLTKVLAGL
jgi:hypothetical protein